MGDFDDHSATPGSETVGQLLVKIQVAARDADDGALARRFYRLEGAMRAFDGVSRRYGFEPADVRQDLLLKFLRWAMKNPDAALDNPDAYARTAAENHVRDLARTRKGEREALSDPSARQDAEGSGLHALRDLEAAMDFENRLLELRTAFERYVEEYAALARQLGGSEVESKSIRCWAMRDVQNLPVPEVACVLGLTDRAEGGAQTVYQWTARGRRRVLELVEWDRKNDPKRAQIMADAVRGED